MPTEISYNYMDYAFRRVATILAGDKISMIWGVKNTGSNRQMIFRNTDDYKLNCKEAGTCGKGLPIGKHSTSSEPALDARLI